MCGFGSPGSHLVPRRTLIVNLSSCDSQAPGMMRLHKLATWPGLPALCKGTRGRALTRSHVQLASDSGEKLPRHGIKKEGTVAEIFQDPVSEGPPLSPRFAELKKEMCLG